VRGIPDPKRGTRLEIGGDIVIDDDPPPFPEIHPDEQFRIV
jgi:hypothetical protein